MKIILGAIVLLYIFIASRKKWFPFEEEHTTLPPQKSLNDYSLNDLRQAYYKKLAESTQLTPELVKLEQDFCELIKKVDQLVHAEYPQSTWYFCQKNVGSSIILNTRIEVNIFTYDCFMEKRTVMIRNGHAYALEPIINAASPEDAPDTVFFDDGKGEIFAEKKTEYEEVSAKTKMRLEEKEETIEGYVHKWFELNFEYLDHLREKELKKGNSSILIEKDKYEEAAAQLMCAFLVEKWGFENSCCTADGIVASMYTE